MLENDPSYNFEEIENLKIHETWLIVLSMRKKE